MNDYKTFPLNPLPASVWVLVTAIAGVEAVLQLGWAGLIGGPDAIGWRLEAVQRLAFTGAHLDWMLETRRFPPEHLLRLLAFPFVHASLIHALFVVVFLLALGKFVADNLRGWTVLVIFLCASIVGALVWGLVFGSAHALLGGYPGVFGLVGAFTFVLWTDPAGKGTNRPRAFILIAALLVVRLIAGLWSGHGSEWLADLAGFATGFALSFLVSPGGWRKIVGKLRVR